LKQSFESFFDSQSHFDLKVKRFIFYYTVIDWSFLKMKTFLTKLLFFCIFNKQQIWIFKNKFHQNIRRKRKKIVSELLINKTLVRMSFDSSILKTDSCSAVLLWTFWLPLKICETEENVFLEKQTLVWIFCIY
jgi:hypothetical protein